MQPSPRKELGQHWLNDEPSLNEIIATAKLSSNDTVLEIGPGQGVLTARLAAAVARVVAVELDQDLITHLQGTMPSHVSVVEQDILDFDFRVLPEGYKVVANIPYYLTSRILRTLLETTNPPSEMTLLVQKEVAERVVAGPGNMSVLSFSVQYYAEPEITGLVTRDKFEPPPEVDSAILHIRRRPEPLFPADRKQLFRLVKAAFSEKRKKLSNALAGGLQLSKDQTSKLLETANLGENSRAQELGFPEWQRLYQAYAIFVVQA